MPVVSSDDSLKKSDDNIAMEIDNLPSSKPCCQQSSRHSIIRACGSTSSTTYVKYKLIYMLKGDALVPQQRWGINRILATLVYYWKDPSLYIVYCQFKTFAYQIVIQKTDKQTSCWPDILTLKDFDTMI